MDVKTRAALVRAMRDEIKQRRPIDDYDAESRRLADSHFDGTRRSFDGRTHKQPAAWYARNRRMRHASIRRGSIDADAFDRWDMGEGSRVARPVRSRRSFGVKR